MHTRSSLASTKISLGVVFCALLSLSSYWGGRVALAHEQSMTIHGGALAGERHRVVVSTDIGGTDPDDFQSMVHLLVYADVLEIEGLIASPYGPGRKEDILRVIDCYEQDYPSLQSHSKQYPTPDQLRSITKQGEVERAPYAGVREATEGSKWIIECARRDDLRPLHVLVWGGPEDLAQALHDAPDILPKLRVYWIGGPNKKWSPDAYQYLVENHPNLWIIESNSTYRGWFVGGNQTDEWGNKSFVSQHIAGQRCLGRFLRQADEQNQNGRLLLSVGWLLNGNPSDPAKPGWGGTYVRAWKRPHVRLHRMPTLQDRMEVFGILEMTLPLVDPKHDDVTTAFLLVDNQQLPGERNGDGSFVFRFCPKSAKAYRFQVKYSDSKLRDVAGGITVHAPDLKQTAIPGQSLPNWWTDDLSAKHAEGTHHGAKTVSRWRADYLLDFANRMRRCR